MITYNNDIKVGLAVSDMMENLDGFPAPSPEPTPEKFWCIIKKNPSLPEKANKRASLPIFISV